MGFGKNKNTIYGVAAQYHNIDKVIVDFKEKTIKLHVGSYVDKLTFEAGKDALHTTVYTVDIAEGTKILNMNKIETLLKKEADLIDAEQV